MKKQPNSRMCFTCGEENPAGVHVRYYEQEDGSVLARFTGQDHHQGYPNRMHGGVIAAILDETIGRRSWPAACCGFGRHQGDARALSPAGAARRRADRGGRITSEDERYFEGTGELLLTDGTVAAEAHAKYRKLDMEQIGDFDPQREKWAVRTD